MIPPEEYRSLAQLCRDRAAIRANEDERRNMLFDAADFERRAALLEADRSGRKRARRLLA